MYWFMSRHSKPSIYNKLLIYTLILKLVWIYGIQLWGYAAPTNIFKIQQFQNKVLRNIVDAPWYIHNSDIPRGLQIPTIFQELQKFTQKHENSWKPNKMAYNNAFQ